MEDKKSNRRTPLPKEGIYIDLNNLRSSNVVPSFIRLAVTQIQKSKGYVRAGSFLRDLSNEDIAWLLDASSELSQTVKNTYQNKRPAGKPPLLLENNDQFFVMFCHILALGEGLPISMMGKDLIPLAHQVINLLKLEQISRVDKNLKLNYRRLSVDPVLAFPLKKEAVRPYQDKEWFVTYVSEGDSGLQKVFAEVNNCYLRGESPDLLRVFSDTLLGGMDPEKVIEGVRKDPRFASNTLKESDAGTQERRPLNLFSKARKKNNENKDGNIESGKSTPNRPTWDF